MPFPSVSRLQNTECLPSLNYVCWDRRTMVPNWLYMANWVLCIRTVMTRSYNAEGRLLCSLDADELLILRPIVIRMWRTEGAHRPSSGPPPSTFTPNSIQSTNLNTIVYLLNYRTSIDPDLYESAIIVQFVESWVTSKIVPDLIGLSAPDVGGVLPYPPTPVRSRISRPWTLFRYWCILS